ncbi:hypothetical protein D3C85_976990 [compost metagenome]
MLVKKSFSSPPPVLRKSPTLSFTSLKMSDSFSWLIPIASPPAASFWNSGVLVFESAANRDISLEALTVLTASAESAPTAAATPAPTAVPTAFAFFSVSCCHFFVLRPAWSIGPVNPPIFAIRSSVSVPKERAAMVSPRWPPA